jgi:peptidoglycan/xylan/chitin deacetylase (PgdA/CDA1 family)
LEEFGLVGWFFVITGFVKALPVAQLQFAQEHDIGMATREYSDGRYALSWSELQEIDRRHVVASHARSHVLLAPLDEAAREHEVLGSQQDFEEHLGHRVRSFVSYGGPEYGTHRPTDALINRAGYQFVFSNLKIQRLREWRQLGTTH